jgi:hypothetical protein
VLLFKVASVRNSTLFLNFGLECVSIVWRRDDRPSVRSHDFSRNIPPVRRDGTEVAITKHLEPRGTPHNETRYWSTLNECPEDRRLNRGLFHGLGIKRTHSAKNIGCGTRTREAQPSAAQI